MDDRRIDEAALASIADDRSPDAAHARRSGRRVARRVLLAAGPLAAMLAGAFVYLSGGRHVETDNAYVRADKLVVSAEVAGTVRHVAVRENQAVRAGELLFRLDEGPFRVAVERARANLAKARTDVSAVQASYREKLTQIELARTNLVYAEREDARQSELAGRGFISAARLDDYRLKVEQSRRQLETNQEELQRIAATLGGRADAPVETHPAYRAALADLERAELDLKRVEVRAPIDGIASRPPKLGQYVAPGAAAMGLVGTADVWIEANYTETELTHVRPGQPATVEVDTYPGREWHGVVESISPATGAEFSVLPAQNATGNWVKVAQRVPVRIALRERSDAAPLRSGLSATVSVDTGHRRTLLGFGLPAGASGGGGEPAKATTR